MVRSITSAPTSFARLQRLRRRDLVVDQDELGAAFLDLALSSSRLPVPKYAAASKLGALLREGVDHLEAERLRELAQLGERSVELGVADARSLDRGDDRAHQAFSRIWRSSVGKA